MDYEQLEDAITKLSDGGSAQVIADFVIQKENNHLALLFMEVCLKKAAEGHHQTREFALAGLKVVDAARS